VLEVTGWALAAECWRRHLPYREGAPCAACGVTVPCPTWVFADSFIAMSAPLTG
jgi:hypothetical protein